MGMVAIDTGSTRKQRGSSLLEALVAFLVLSLGMLVVARMQLQWRLDADVARQRSEALRLAQEDLESQRAFAALAPSAAASAYADIRSASSLRDASTGYASDTSYRIARQVDPAPAPQAKSVAVTVTWSDRAGRAQSVVLPSMIAGIDPAYSGALALKHGAALRGAWGRSVRIPLGAKDLGDGRSALKLSSSATMAVVFDNLTGAVTGRCTVAATLSTADLTPVALGNCDAIVGDWLSGTIHFASGTPAGTSPTANDPPLPTTVSLSLTGGPYAFAPSCAVDAVLATGDPHLAYHCAVYPAAGGKWSGRLSLQPLGWSIGGGATDRRVCRYTAGLDGSGAVDANIEHPASYSDVDTALLNQNYLVIIGSQSCPAGTAPHQP